MGDPFLGFREKKKKASLIPDLYQPQNGSTPTKEAATDELG